ncbi:MAG TPA: hypothetical protein VFZ22_13140 [Pyrinomonadaceae bacterium]|nr:hypothetical protein [Pyrinomonadaceae bacterium]
MKAILIALFLAYSTAVSAQTVRDIEHQYGQRQPVYSVSRNIWMTPDYAADGQVCRMRLYPKRVDGNTDVVGAALQYNELRGLLNSLVPPNQRGMKSKINFGATATGGPATWTTYPYDKVTFTFTSSFSRGKSDDSSPLRKGEFTFPLSEANRGAKEETRSPSDYDFQPSERSMTEIVTIRWNNRKCN